MRSAVAVDRSDHDRPVALEELEQRTDDECAAHVDGVRHRALKPHVDGAVLAGREQGEPVRTRAVEIALQERRDAPRALGRLTSGVRQLPDERRDVARELVLGRDGSWVEVAVAGDERQGLGPRLRERPQQIGVHARHAWRLPGACDSYAYEARTECTGGSFVAAVNQVLPASPEPNTSPEVAPK